MLVTIEIYGNRSEIASSLSHRSLIPISVSFPSMWTSITRYSSIKTWSIFLYTIFVFVESSKNISRYVSTLLYFRSNKSATEASSSNSFGNMIRKLFSAAERTWSMVYVMPGQGWRIGVNWKCWRLFFRLITIYNFKNWFTL